MTRPDSTRRGHGGSQTSPYISPHLASSICILHNETVICSQLVRSGDAWGIPNLCLVSEVRAISLATVPLTCGVCADSRWSASEQHRTTAQPQSHLIQRRRNPMEKSSDKICLALMGKLTKKGTLSEMCPDIPGWQEKKCL